LDAPAKANAGPGTKNESTKVLPPCTAAARSRVVGHSGSAVATSALPRRSAASAATLAPSSDVVSGSATNEGRDRGDLPADAVNAANADNKRAARRQKWLSVDALQDAKEDQEREMEAYRLERQRKREERAKARS